ncbi:hypothetical protein [Streptomyces xanthochromogenes]|uniref:hypothetical protein n=1 Tax=Streptomyces xanthochromogenes TaxID=67384 RepID=UPI002F4098F6
MCGPAAGAFRALTGIVLAQALDHAGTRLYEPYRAFGLAIRPVATPQDADRTTPDRKA